MFLEDYLKQVGLLMFSKSLNDATFSFQLQFQLDQSEGLFI